MRIAEHRGWYSLGNPLSTMWSNSSLPTFTPTAQSLSLASLILCKNTFTQSFSLILWSSIFKFGILDQEEEANLFSKAFHTSMADSTPITTETTAGERVELIKVTKAWSQICHDSNSELIREVISPLLPQINWSGIGIDSSRCWIKG